MEFNCPVCGKALKWKNDISIKKGRCPRCSNIFEVPVTHTISHASDKTYYNAEKNALDHANLKKENIFSRMMAYLRSPRKITYQKKLDSLKISFYVISQYEIKKNWIVGLFLIIGFGILPLVLGVGQTLFALLKGGEDNPFVQGYMVFLLFFFFIPPIIVYKSLIIPLFTIRTMILDSYQITICDSFLEKKPKIKCKIPKENLIEVILRESSTLEKLNQQKNEKIYLKHKKGKYELISTYPTHDLLRIQKILDKYNSGETINKVQDISEQVQKTIPETEIKEYPWYKLIFYHIFGKKDVKIAPLIRYLAINTWIGGFGLFSAIIGITMPGRFEEQASMNASNYIVILLLFSLPLFLGWPLNKLFKIPESFNRQLLGLDGFIILGTVIYMLSMLLPGIKESFQTAQGISHSPGIITFLASYGTWLICAFGPIKNFHEHPFGRWIPRAVFVTAAIIDLYILYLVISTGFSRMGDMVKETQKMEEMHNQAQ